MKLVILVVAVCFILFQSSLFENTYETIQKARMTAIGEIKHVEAQYESWKKRNASVNPNGELLISLGYSKALSTQHSTGMGVATIDIQQQKVTVIATELPSGPRYSAWIVSNKMDSPEGIQPHINDTYFYLGELEGKTNKLSLEKSFLKKEVEVIRPDLIVITEYNQHPSQQRILVGLPSLFQKLSHNESISRILVTHDDANNNDVVDMLFNNIGISSAQAHKRRKHPEKSSLYDLIILGEKIFFNETFNGNGRTCSTCHPALNNFTIDPQYISKLPDDDPLFVAEFNPNLTELENSVLLRQFALVRINIDGFEDPVNKHVMRSVPHTLALSTSLESGVDFPAQHTGWSGDGAPGNGTLREFSAGAVTQHLTKSLNRIPGIDFRLPTEHELDALEAFMLSLGRQKDPDLSAMKFSSEFVESGKMLFLDNSDSGGRCQLCHENGGANFEMNVNINGDTGVEAILNQPARFVDNTIPIDGGFGTDPHGGFDNYPNSDGSFGNRKFNIVSVIEAADTAPFFHNNSMITLESAVNFYNSNAFNGAADGGISPDVGIIDLEATDVQSIASFLRVINALENIRWSNSIVDRVMQSDKKRGRELLAIALANTQDALNVLQEGRVLHQDAIALITRAIVLERTAFKKYRNAKRNKVLRRAKRIKLEAADLMVSFK